MTSQPEIHHDKLGEFIIYTTDDGHTDVHLRLIDDTVWMTQAEMAELFDVSRSSISEHAKSIFNSGELDRTEVVRKFRKEAGQGAQGRHLDHYNLDAIMAIGFRIRGPRGAQFRRWATDVLTEYLIKGFVLNDEKLKDPRGADYFNELLARIRDIRSSEARLYLHLRDIIALADDYSPNNTHTRHIYATIQDKLHYAITGNTASEIIATRCDPTADNLGLTTWKGTKVRKKDVTTAKNYLTEPELKHLNLLVSQFLEYAQLQAESRRVVHMSDWLDKTDRFIEFNERQPLEGHGRITRKQANQLAVERYDLYNQNRLSTEEEALDAELVATMKELDRRLTADRRRLAPRAKNRGEP